MGVETWDCHLHEDVLVIPWALAFQGDNPMASEFASHVGMSRNMYCRVCKAKKSSETAQGLRNFMTVGNLRSKDETLEDLKMQEARVLDGAPSAADGLATATGSKDKYFMSFVAKLQEAASTWRTVHAGQSAEEGQTKAAELKSMLKKLREDTMPESLFNPVLAIDGEY